VYAKKPTDSNHSSQSALKEKTGASSNVFSTMNSTYSKYEPIIRFRLMNEECGNSSMPIK